MANRQSTDRVRTAHTLHVGFEVPCNSQQGMLHSHARGRLDMQATLRLAENGVSGWFWGYLKKL